MVPRRDRTRGAASLFAAVVLLVGCGASEAADGTSLVAAPPTLAPTDAPTAPTDPPTEGTATGPTDGTVPEALRFTAPLVGGGTFDGTASADLPVAFWFWAPT